MTSTAAQPVRRFDSLRQEAFLNLWRSYDRLHTLEEQLFLQYDLTPQQYNVLRLLRPAGIKGLPTLEVQSRLVSRAPDITRMLDRLESKALVERTRLLGDRRTVIVRITAAGVALLRRLVRPVRECHDAQLSHLNDAELARLIALLRKARLPHEPLKSHWK
jgi:DNA-binding MarR family transcriptional regulator